MDRAKYPSPNRQSQSPSRDSPQEKGNLSKEKQDLIDLTDHMHGILDRLRNDVIVRDERERAQDEGDVADTQDLTSIKSEMSKVHDKFKKFMNEGEFYDMSPEEREKALKDMADAIHILTEEYRKERVPNIN